MTTKQKETGIIQINNEQDLKAVLAKQYMKSIENLFGDKEKALEFLTNVVASVQRVPKLLECTPDTLLNSFMTMASLKLMPSGVSGEAYVLPYEKGRGTGIFEAQFQLGYQGLVTLFYRAGAKSIVAEIVYAKDQFSNLNGEIQHVFDPFSEDRGEPIGAYVIIELQTGGKVYKAMSKKQILEIGEKFSKSYSSNFSPWGKGNDPQGWMWKKTVLKQAGKLVPKNETLNHAIAEDNKDSVIGDRKDLPEALPPADFSKDEAALRKSPDMVTLNFIWADMSGDAKLALKHVYDEMKSIIEDSVKVNPV